MRWADHIIRRALPPTDKNIQNVICVKYRKVFNGMFLQAVGPLLFVIFFITGAKPENSIRWLLPYSISLRISQGGRGQDYQ